MNNDKISERLDEHEKRIFFNNSFAKNKTDELQTSLNELETAVETATTSIETIQTELETAETSLSELETLTQTHTSEIAELTTENETSTANITNLQTAQTQTQTALTTAQNLITNLQTNLGTAETSITNLQTAQTQTQTALDTAEDAITDHETRITDVEAEISNIQPVNVTNLNTRITSAETNITTLQADLGTAEETITDHETRITTLESSSSGDTAPLPNYYGITIGEISNLENEILDNEPYTHNGGNYKFTIGTKSPNGPYGSIFTRINPTFNLQFMGSIKLYLFNVPAGQTTTSLNLTINGTTTALTPTIDTTDNTITLPFDFETGTIFNRFDIAFTDTLLAETFLDYIEITATQGANFACLNKDYSFFLFNYLNRTYSDYHYASKNVGHSHTSRLYSDTTSLAPNSYYNYATQTIDGVVYDATKLKSYINMLRAYAFHTVYENIVILLPTNTLCFYNPFLGPQNLFVDNVYDASISFNHEEDWVEFCGTKYDLSVFIGKNSTSMAILPTLSNQNLPKDFVLCLPIQERSVRVSEPFVVGYLLLHKTGEILYYPQKNATYFVKLGKGVEPKAYLQDGRTEIVVYYQNFAKTNVIRKKLTLNATTNKWEITSSAKIYPNIQEICEYGENIMFIKQNNRFTAVDRY